MEFNQKNYDGKLKIIEMLQAKSRLKVEMEKTKKILTKNKDLLDLIAKTLIEKETLTKEEIDYLVEHKCLPIEEEKELTFEELKNIAKERKIKGYTKMTKEELKKSIKG